MLWIAFTLFAASDPQLVTSTLKRFSEVHTLTAKFIEEKSIALLQRPLQSSGRVIYDRSLGVARVVDTPHASTILLLPGRLVSIQNGRRSQIPVTESMSGLVDAFRDLLRGDLQRLEATFEVGAETQGDLWSVSLSPRSANARRAITLIRLMGRGLVIESLAVVEANGDRSTAHFADVRTDASLTDAERALLSDAP